jgi:hypothetical protein
MPPRSSTDSSPRPTRRKRKRRPQPLSPWEAEVHWNLLTFPLQLLAALLLVACIACAALLKPPLLDDHPRLVGMGLIGLLFWMAGLSLRPFAHLHWRVGDAWIISTQPTKGASHTLTVENAGFVRMEPFGPLIRVTRRSEKSVFWPRWLRRQGKMYAFELQHDRMRLRALGAPELSPASKHPLPETGARRGP